MHPAVAIRLGPATSRLRITGDEGAPPGIFRLGYRPWFDTLRGVAVVLVVAHHFRLIPNGALGVDIFFVLSGFLITALLHEEFVDHGSIRLGRFYMRRALRLLPLLYAMLLAYYAYALLSYGEERYRAAVSEIFVVATYMVNMKFLHGIEPRMMGHAWTLSMEEQFYFLWPIALLVMLKLEMPKKHVLGLLTAGIALVFAWRVHLYNSPNVARADWVPWVMRIYSGPDTRGDALLVGCVSGLLAAWNFQPTSARGKFVLRCSAWLSVAALAYAALCVPWSSPAYFNGGYTVIAVLAAIMICNSVANAPQGLGESPWLAPLNVLGKLSYALYLVHVPVMFLTRAKLGWNHLWQTAIVGALSLGLAVLCNVAIEKPFLKLKRYFQPGAECLGSRSDGVARDSVPANLPRAA